MPWLIFDRGHTTNLVGGWRVLRSDLDAPKGLVPGPPRPNRGLLEACHGKSLFIKWEGGEGGQGPASTETRTTVQTGGLGKRGQTATLWNRSPQVCRRRLELKVAQVRALGRWGGVVLLLPRGRKESWSESRPSGYERKLRVVNILLCRWPSSKENHTTPSPP